ncbi:MAG: LacI family transcriptional regulator [Lentisphaeria bacterium]|jgi:LacI family transcriptional regulator
MATIYEVSKLAGVSLATVSRVINNNTKVSEKARNKVLEAMELLQYKPNIIAQSLASNRTNSVGILVCELHGEIFGHMMTGIESALRDSGKHVFIAAGHSDKDNEKQGIDFLVSRNCDAMIVNAEGVSDDFLVELSKKKTPVFIMSRWVAEIGELCISLDNELGGYLATKHILDSGHTNFVCVAGTQSKPDGKDRLAGYKRALAEYDIPIAEKLIYYGDFTEPSGIDALKHFIAQKYAFTAVICANDEMASGVMKYAREYGFKLPDDISIIGFDNVKFSNHLYPSLTTIDYPIKEMGRMAAKFVLRDVYGETEVESKNVFEPKLVLRDSVKNI